MEWNVTNGVARPSDFPHELPRNLKRLSDKEAKFLIKTTGAKIILYPYAYDCGKELPYWYLLKDTPFDISSLKAKRRYEINKGVKNYRVEIIKKEDIFKNGNEDGLYKVYFEATSQYPIKYRRVQSKDTFMKFLHGLVNNPASILFVGFDRETGKICGYLDAYDRTPYIPISSMHTLPSCECKNITFALIAALLDYYNDKIASGEVYVSEGERNVSHQTEFHSFLVKYFDFRHAYTKIHLYCTWYIKLALILLSPFYKLLSKTNNRRIYQLVCVMRLYRMSCECDKQ